MSNRHIQDEWRKHKKVKKTNGFDPYNTEATGEFEVVDFPDGSIVYNDDYWKREWGMREQKKLEDTGPLRIHRP